jgi:hypothetical protein
LIKLLPGESGGGHCQCCEDLYGCSTTPNACRRSLQVASGPSR